ncbi:MAG: tetratricopeptide repeat protein [Pseudomonadota bacterium]
MRPSPGVLALLILCLLPPLGSPCASEKGIFLTENTELKVADAFMDEREYYRAITEYKKFLILFPESDKADYAVSRIGMAYYHGEEFEASTRTLANLRDKYPESSYAAETQYFEGLGYWKLKKYADAKTALERVAASYPDSDYAPLAMVADSMLALDQDNVNAGRHGMERLIAVYPDYPASMRAAETLGLFDQYRDLPRKSELLAGIMSAVVPGSGYIYAEHYGDGITAFLINALAIAGTVTAVCNENYAVAAIVGGVGLPFYLGNIYGSANAAKKWNIAVRNELRNRISVTLDYDF